MRNAIKRNDIENKDLKDFLKDKGLIDQFGQVIDDE